jgi:hypothetical protein
MYTPPPTLVVDRFPLPDSRAQRRIRRALMKVLGGSLRQSFWFSEAPVLHYALPLTPQSRDDVREVDEVIPCLAAWDRFIFPHEPGPGPLKEVPTWVCEVGEDDGDQKLAVHARAGVRRAWLLNPVLRSCSVFALGPGGRFEDVWTPQSGDEWRLLPFETVPITTAALWGRDA